MQEVAVENYGAFIAASEALSFVRAQLESFDGHLEAMVMRPAPPCSLYSLLFTPLLLLPAPFVPEVIAPCGSVNRPCAVKHNIN